MEQNTKSLREDNSLNDKKPVIVVTGSSGLIGTRIIGRLAADYQIVGLDKEGNPYPTKEAECVNFDITDSDSIKLALDRIRYGYRDKIRSVIHLAAY